MSTRIGYARVSSRDQNLDGQLDMLKAAGCVKIFQDKASGIKESRPGWDGLLEYVRPGDTIVVAELSRMTRSLQHLLVLIKQFESGINLVSLRENIDTSSATGRAFIAIMGTINQMERELRAERTAAGRAAARARGRTGGRPRTSIEKLEQARILYDNGGGSATVVCKTFGIGRRTFFNHLAAVRQAAIATQREGAANPSGETGTD